MKSSNNIKSFGVFNENLNISDVSDSIKDRNVYVSFGRSISGNWDDGYEFEGTLEDFSKFILNIINGLDDDERKYIISKL